MLEALTTACRIANKQIFSNKKTHRDQVSRPIRKNRVESPRSSGNEGQGAKEGRLAERKACAWRRQPCRCNGVVRSVVNSCAERCPCVIIDETGHRTGAALATQTHDLGVGRVHGLIEA